MALKTIKRIIPHEVKDCIRYGIRILDGVKGRKEIGYSYQINKDYIEKYNFYSVPNRHCFMGYYDFEQIHNNKLIALSVDKKANPKHDKADIVCFDLYNPHEYSVIGDTGAWCWQQGSRIKWLQNRENCIICNDIERDKYISKIIDVNNKTCESIISEPLYDIASDESYGISLNFERSERLRPGYGYSVLKDKTSGECYPDNDGLWYVNISSGKKELLVSLYELAEEDIDRDMYEHYINHISISPNNEKIFFLYIKKELYSERRCTAGYIYDMKARRFFPLNISGMSHYDWLDDNQIIYVAGMGGGKIGYFSIDISSLEKTQIGENILVEDGHPTCLSEGIISDTYPHKNQYQELFYYDSRVGKNVIGKFFHKPTFHHDERCDLHPRLSKTPEGFFLTIDTTCNNGVRSVFGGKLNQSMF